MKSSQVSFAVTALLLCITGCSSIKNVTPSDLTVAELEAHKANAVDPGKRIKSIKTSILRQEIKTSHGWMEPETIQMVEIKYQAPDKMSVMTFDENQPVDALIINGKQAWRIDYEQKSCDPVPSTQLEKVQFMQKLAEPGSKLSELFDEITVDRCTIDDEPLYRMTCLNQGENPFYFYLAASDYLPRRVASDIKLPNGDSSYYESNILRYRMYEGMLIPDETVIDQDGLIQKGKVIYYKVNLPIDEKEFRPPMF